MMELSNVELGTMVMFVLLMVFIAWVIYDSTKDEYGESWRGSWRHDRR